MPDRTEEARAAYRRYVATRERVHAGEVGWDALAAFFTDDAVFIDPAWGRVEGRPAIEAFMQESMAGLDDWTFPELWTVVEGDRVVSAWMNRLGGQRDDGTFYETMGVSVLTYAGDGRFSSEHDLLNMGHVFELVGESGWVPGPGFNAPPEHPVR